ncbi:CCAAT/enhancer-binding protein zeta [Strongylocentrotus purpuratus]|uniref:CCAAT/enhancer-binding protein zeta n=1 Tax=Strongylocentrotus purpuratus TaxID=7668 RepID=A0A7M7PTK9_STRPU|nr:CCAAT/enhancer-binding protein zeta [Strongylocentrotus purpuratus]
MKTKKKIKAQKTKSPVDRNDDEELSGLVSGIHDDGGEIETAGLGDGEDIPASEISDVIKKLKLDRFKDIAKKPKEKPVQKQDKTAGQTAGQKNKKQLQDKTQKKDKIQREDKPKEDKPQKKDNSTPGTPATSKKNQKKKNNEKQKDGGNQNKDKNPPSGAAKTPIKERTEKPAQVEKQIKNEKIKGALGLEVPKTSSILLPTGTKWHSIQDGVKATGSPAVSSEGVVSSYMEYATKLYDQEVELHAAKKSSDSGSQSRWMQTVAKSGALSDKVAALTLEVQGAPIHTPLSLDALLAMVKKKGRREALIGLDAAKRLFLEELLPSNRRLTTFAQHSFEDLEKRCSKNRQSRDKQVLLWFFEDQLKQKYGSLLDMIEKMLQDTVSAIKAKALSCCYELIVNRPEEEKRLLRLIVNKVGDPDYKVAAKAVHWLQKLVDVHSMMKIVVVQAIEELLFRPNINTKAQYYAVCFLNQLVLHPEEDQLATQLIIVYLSFFKACTKQKKIDNKMLSAVITGVHRAFPYSKEDEKVHEQLDTLLKVVHQTTFNTSIQALLLIKQVLDKRQSTMDRFYSALYRKLLDPHLSSSPRHAMFLNLLYQTLKSDDVINRVKAFVKRLLQVCSWQQSPFIAAVLVLVSELIKAKPSLGKVNSWNDDDDEDEHFMDVQEEEEDDDEGKEGGVDAKGRTTSHPEKPQPGSKDKASWVHRPVRPGGKEGVPSGYDPLARNPLHSHVDNAVMWELKVLSNHFHPSVSLFASQLLAGSLVFYTGNPLQDFTPGRFLDRFVYKNPKQKQIGKESVMQPKSRSYKPPAIRSMPVNSKNFTSMTEESVPIDEMFFHRFFSQKDLKDKKSKDSKKDKKADSQDNKDGKSDDEDEEEDFDEKITSNANMEAPDEIDSDASSVDDDEFDRILDEIEGGQEDEEDDIDFAREFQKKPSKKSKKRKAEEDDSSSDDDDEDDDEEDDVGMDDEDDDEEEIGESADVDGLDEEAFDMSDEEEEPLPVKASKRKQKQDKKSAKKQRKNTQELGDVTEQISSMIDENVGSKFDVGLNALANKDKADMKQLRWEMDRDRWVRGVDARTKVRAKKLQKGPKAKGFRGRGKKR